MPQVRKYIKRVKVNWLTDVPPRWTLEERPIKSLRLHEVTAQWRVYDIAASMLAGKAMPVAAIGRDGMVLDGHHRVKAAALVLGEDASIPVAVHEVR